MPYQGRGVPYPDHRRVARATDPKLRAPVPAIDNPQANADVITDQQVVTLNRAGSNPRNPILKGLGFHLTLPLGTSDSLKGLWLFQRHGAPGANQVGLASVEAPGVWGYEFLVGSGRSKSGDKDTGAVRNFVRVKTALQSYEKSFYSQDYEADVVTLNGEAALDPDTLEAVEVTAELVDADRDWLDVAVDFMRSWNDTFQVQNDRNDADKVAGFLKSNGGALWVSFFDKTPGTEGVGTQVNPITQAAIENRRKIQVENTAGLKELVCRFRSRQDSPYFVDVPIKILVVDNVETCVAPETEPCTDLYMKKNAATPEGLPSVPSVPGVQVTAGPGLTIPADLLIVTMRGATVGASPKLWVEKLKWVASAPALVGGRFARVGDIEEYLPLVQEASSPAVSEPFGDPKRFTIAFSRTQLINDDVAFLQIVLVDGAKPGWPVLVPATQARAVASFPYPVGTGGGVTCSPY